jgi:DNA-binding CsgD family transcriptional regulator
MTQDIVSCLSPMQKTCLRLVYEHLQSKEIARQLGLSRYTVESHIRSARSRLGASTRLEAARMLAALEAAESGTSPRAQEANTPNAIAGDGRLIELSSPDEAVAGWSKEQSIAPWGSDTKLYKVLPLPKVWGEQNDLTNSQRLIWMVALAILICLSLGAVMSSLQVLASIF